MPRRPPKFSFHVTVTTDNETGELLSVYLRIRKGRADEVLEIIEGAAFANYDKDGNLLGVELLEPCSVSVIDKLSKREPVIYRSKIRDFMKRSAPREMVTA